MTDPLLKEFIEQLLACESFQELDEVRFEDRYPKGFMEFYNKYKKVKNSKLYVQFTNHAGSVEDRNAFQNPDHSDPVGVYGYPLSYVISHPSDVWYGGAAAYLRVIEDTSRNKLVLPHMTMSDATRILYQMGIKFGSDLMATAKKTFKHSGVTAVAQSFMSVVQVANLSDMANIKRGETPPGVVTRSGIQQTALFKAAGIDALEDRAKSDKQASINGREPEQIIFLTRNAFRPVEVFELRTKQQKGGIGTSDQPDEILYRKIAAMVARNIGDQLTSEFEKLHHQETGPIAIDTFFTRAGRMIAVDFKRPQSYYDQHSIGQKKHKDSKKSDTWFPTIWIWSEFGTEGWDFDSDQTSEQIAAAAAANWNAWKQGKPVIAGWQPYTLSSYKNILQAKRAETNKAQWEKEEKQEEQRFISNIKDWQSLAAKVNSPLQLSLETVDSELGAAFPDSSKYTILGKLTNYIVFHVKQIWYDIYQTGVGDSERLSLSKAKVTPDFVQSIYQKFASRFRENFPERTEALLNSTTAQQMVQTLSLAYQRAIDDDVFMTGPLYRQNQIA